MDGNWQVACLLGTVYPYHKLSMFVKDQKWTTGMRLLHTVSSTCHSSRPGVPDARDGKEPPCEDGPLYLTSRTLNGDLGHVCDAAQGLYVIPLPAPDGLRQDLQLQLLPLAYFLTLSLRDAEHSAQRQASRASLHNYTPLYRLDVGLTIRSKTSHRSNTYASLAP